MSAEKRITYLSISPFPPHDGAAHAGGKIYNYVISRISENPQYDIRVVSFAEKGLSLSTRQKNGNVIYHLRTRDPFLEMKRLALGAVAAVNPFSKWGLFFKYPYFAHYFLTELRRLKKRGYCPDIISLEWTQSILLAGKIRRIFPQSRLAGVEHDISFQRFARRIPHLLPILKAIASFQYRRLLRAETESLQALNLCVCLNEKDRKLIDHRIDPSKILVFSPYFEHHFSVTPDYSSKTLVYFGNMKRLENHVSVKWFLEKVYPALQSEVPDVRLLIIGAEPRKDLYDHVDSSVTITGFVENVSDYLQKGACLVAPLILGGGIKIKVLEAMSAGLPVVTNTVGIEGIPALDGSEYLHAEEPREFERKILMLIRDPAAAKTMGERARLFIREKFNYEESFKDYYGRLAELASTRN